MSRRESLCYIALLELGSSKVGLIVRKTGIPSSKIYEVLDKLIARGMVSYVTIGNIRHYQASDPKVILDSIEEKKREAERILPELLLKQKLSKKQGVEMYEGQKAIFGLFTSLIGDARPKEQYLVFSINEENKSDAVNLFFRNLSVRRKDKGLDTMILKNIRYREKVGHSSLRFTGFDLPQGITVFRDIAVMLSWGEKPIAVRIESAVIAGQFRDFFLGLWKIARKW